MNLLVELKIELYNEALSHTKIMQLILNKNYQKSYQSNRELLFESNVTIIINNEYTNYVKTSRKLSKKI